MPTDKSLKEINDLKKLSFEDALYELEEIVQKIDHGGETLESAIRSFERGILLKNHCEQKLQDACLKIEKITKLANSKIIIEEIKL